MNGFEIFTYTLGSFLKKRTGIVEPRETSETEIDFVKGVYVKSEIVGKHC